MNEVHTQEEYSVLDISKDISKDKFKSGNMDTIDETFVNNNKQKIDDNLIDDSIQ
jgi:hypothetical protein